MEFESVRFDNGSPACSLPTPPSSLRNVTVTRGSRQPLPPDILVGVASPVKEVANHFASACCRVNQPPVLHTSPPRRTAKAPEGQISVRRSERLARKSRHRATKPELQAQNVMMRRLGLTSTTHPPDASAFRQYVDTFSSQLSTSQCEALDTLLPAGAPHACLSSSVSVA